MNRTRVGIVLFPDVEVLDFCGPFEVFSVTRTDETSRYQDTSPFDVSLIAEHADAVVTTGGMQVLPHATFDDCPALDFLIVPGGIGTRKLEDDRVLLDWLSAQASEVQVLASVCTGAMLLGRAGLLGGLAATTHWRSLDRMRDAFPDVEVRYDKHFVKAGSIYTSAGISAGIDMSLRIVADHLGEEIARATARHMEYPYPESDDRRITL